VYHGLPRNTIVPAGQGAIFRGGMKNPTEKIFD
jgi:hypothetical protein